jgi:hypothetical protein
MANSKKCIKAAIATLVMGGTLMTASPALAHNTTPLTAAQERSIGPVAHAANAVGQCNGPKGRVVHKTTDLEVIVKSEGKKALAQLQKMAKSHNWNEKDESLHNWLKQHTILLRTKKQIEIVDYYCPKGSGDMRVWKKEKIRANTPVVAVLPDNLSKNDVSTSHKKGFDLTPVDFRGLALGNCSNGIEAAFEQSIYVRKGKVPEKPVKPQPAKPAPSAQPATQQQPSCTATSTGNGPGSETAQCGSANVNICSVKGQDNNDNQVCSPTTIVIVTPPTCDTSCGSQPSHSTSVVCRGFEEVSVGGSFLVDCDVASDTNSASSIKIKINPSSDGQLHTRYSGVGCLTEARPDYTPATCSRNGTYEFRISGINDITKVMYSSVTVTATANGVSDVFESSDFPVDPDCGGFGCGTAAAQSHV